MCEFHECKIDNGYVCFYEKATNDLNLIDNHFKSWINEMGGVEYYTPALIDGETLEKCGYFSSFPQHLTVAAFVKPEFYENVVKESKVKSEYINIEQKYFTPAVCLHVYPMLEGNKPKSNQVITTRARAYRYEQGKFEDMTRIWDFTVREFIFVGEREYVHEKLNEIKLKVLDFTKKIGLPAEVVKANDHFYPSMKNIIKTKLQHANSLKSELAVYIKGKEVAIASFNFHDNHFSKPFNFDDSGKIVTGCVGFGLERWIAAIAEYNIELDKIDI